MGVEMKYLNRFVLNKTEPGKKNRAVRIKKAAGERIFDSCNAIFMILFCFTILVPFWDMIVKSFSRPIDISYTKLNLFPPVWTLEAYQYCFRDDTFIGAFGISVLRTVFGTAIHLLCTCMAAYTLTRTELPLRKTITVYLLIPMFFSGGMIPTYINMRNLHLLNNFLVYIIPGAFSIYNAIILRNYFFSIDHTIEEAASIDGASSIRIFFTIILPLSKPVLATVMLWQMVGHWNSWFDNMIYCFNNENLLTLQYYLRRLQEELTRTPDTPYGLQTMESAINMSPDTVKAATTVLVILPIVLVYPFLQKYFVKGIMIGAVKG